jgi:hypothetical protein
MKKKLLTLLAVGMLCAVNANAANWVYDGTITNCPDLCLGQGGAVGNAVTGSIDLDMGAPESGYAFNLATDGFNFDITISTGVINLNSSSPDYLGFSTPTLISTDPGGNFLSGTIVADISAAVLGAPAFLTIDLSGGSLSIDAFGVGGIPVVGTDGSFTPQVVPLPAAAWLFGSALLGLMGVARRKRA